MRIDRLSGGSMRHGGALAAVAVFLGATFTAAAPSSMSLAPLPPTPVKCVVHWDTPGSSNCQVTSTNFEYEGFSFELSPHVAHVGQHIDFSYGLAGGAKFESVLGLAVVRGVPDGCWSIHKPDLPCKSFVAERVTGACFRGNTYTGGGTFTPSGDMVCPEGTTYKPGYAFASMYVTGWPLDPDIRAVDTSYVAVVPRGDPILSGTVRNADGAPLRGVTVSATGAGSTVKTTTGSDGGYAMMLGSLTYDVRAAANGVCAVGPSECRNPVRVTMSRDVRQSFEERAPTAVEGVVLDHRGKPLSGVVVKAGEKYRATTGKDGTYTIELGKGTYEVRPVPGGRTDRERYTPASRSVEITTRPVKVDFKLVAADEVSLKTKPEATGLSPGYQLHNGLWWTIAPPNGIWEAPVTVKVENGRGDPVADESVTLREPIWLVAPRSSEGGPRMIACDDAWRRIAPGGDVKRITDGNGELSFTVFTGTDLASFTITAAESADAGFFDLGRFGQLGEVSPATPQQFLSGAGAAKQPGSASTLATVQERWLDWLLAAHAGVGTAPFQAGDFGPIRTADRKNGGIVFYPEHNPGPLRDYLAGRIAQLPSGYTAWVLPIRQELSLGPWSARPAEIVQLAAWEKETAKGKAQPGYVAVHANETLAYFGYPYPPAAGSADLAHYDRCVPGASPTSPR